MEGGEGERVTKIVGFKKSPFEPRCPAGTERSSRGDVEAPRGFYSWPGDGADSSIKVGIIVSQANVPSVMRSPAGRYCLSCYDRSISIVDLEEGILKKTHLLEDVFFNL